MVPGSTSPTANSMARSKGLILTRSYSPSLAIAILTSRCMSAGGVLLIEPRFTPETWRPGTVHARFIDEPDLKIARINTSFVDGRLSSMDMHYLIGTPEGPEHYVERHSLGLFTSDEMTHVLTDCGLEVTYDEAGLTGRGVYIGQRAHS